MTPVTWGNRLSATAAYVASDVDELPVPASGASIFERSRAISASLTRLIASPMCARVEAVVAADEGHRIPHELEDHDVGRPEAPLEPARIGESRGPPHREREVGIDAGPRRGFRQRPALAVGSQGADRGEADEPPSSCACTSSGIDAPTSSVRYVRSCERAAASGAAGS